MINRRQQHVRRVIGFGAIVVLLLGAGALLVRVSRPPSLQARDHADANARSEPVGEGRSDGAEGGHDDGAGGTRPIGVSQDETGAVTAAVAYTAASQRWLYLSDPGRPPRLRRRSVGHPAHGEARWP